MKKSIVILLLMFFVANVAEARKHFEVVKIKTSAVCEMCKTRIEHVVGLSKGVKKVNLNLDDKVCEITYNPRKTNVEKLKQVIAATGYSADELPAETAGFNKLPACCQKPMP